MGEMSSYYNVFLSENQRNYISTRTGEKKGSPPLHCKRKLHAVIDLIPHFPKFRNVVLLASSSISIYYFQHFKCFSMHVITLAAGSGTVSGRNFLTVTRINKGLIPEKKTEIY